MRRKRILAGGLLLLSFGAALLLIDDARPPLATAAGGALDLTTSDTCKGCHAEVWAEWKTSLHEQSYTDPMVLATGQSNNFRNENCIPCHAPSPVFETGLGKVRVVERVSQRELGVDCLTCHRAHDTIIGPATAAAGAAKAACQPIGHTELASPALCAPCHNQHNTVDEWEASSYPKAGITCLDCHMQPVTRRRADGSSGVGRSHRFPGGHDLEMLGKAFTLVTAVTVDDAGKKRLVVSVTNTGTGHNFPADARHRALDLVVTLLQPDGVEVPPRDSPRPYGRERGTARRRFRNPYREESERLLNREQFGRENTQIVAGETLTFDVPFDSAAVNQARVELIYKLTPIQNDDEGVRVHDALVQL